MFLGEYQTSFSGHGRVILPKKFRQVLGGDTEIVLSRGFEGCIWGFALKDFEKEAERELQMPVTDKEARNVRRYMFSAAESVSLDDQGRFVIPGTLLEYAGITDRVAIIGAGDHFEIWNPENWKKVINQITREGES
jgi:MraZ protein